MKLHEYQSKQIFSQVGIPIPKGAVANRPEDIRPIVEKLGPPLALKSQVLVSERAKAGGVKIVRSLEEAIELGTAMFKRPILGLQARKLLIEQALAVESEIYLGLTVDRAERSVVMVGSATGGSGLENVARRKPSSIIKQKINPLLGLQKFQGRRMAYDLGLQGNQALQFSRIARALYQALIENDALLAEINPLVLTPRRRLVAVDGKITIDDNALFRQKILSRERDTSDERLAETIAREHGMSYVQLKGNIGCVVNGAGLAMATMDFIEQYGGHAANFLDLGGSATVDKITTALRLLLSDANVKVILVNIFGGITRCDTIAHGLLAVARERDISVPMVVRLAGTNEVEGLAMLQDTATYAVLHLKEAVQQAIALSQVREAV